MTLGGGAGAGVGLIAAMTIPGVGLGLGAAMVMWGYAIGSMIDPMKAPKQESPYQKQDIQFNTFQRNLPVPLCYGIDKVSGPLLWIGNESAYYVEEDIDDSGGSGGDSPSGATHMEYSADFAVGLSEGPISGVFKAWLDDRDMTQYLGKTIHVYTGTNSQQAHPYVQKDPDLKGLFPTWRNTAYIIAHGELGATNRLPVFSALVSGRQIDLTTVASDILRDGLFGSMSLSTPWVSSIGSQGYFTGELTEIDTVNYPVGISSVSVALWGAYYGGEDDWSNYSIGWSAVTQAITPSINDAALHLGFYYKTETTVREWGNWFHHNSKMNVRLFTTVYSSQVGSTWVNSCEYYLQEDRSWKSLGAIGFYHSFIRDIESPKYGAYGLSSTWAHAEVDFETMKNVTTGPLNLQFRSSDVCSDAVRVSGVSLEIRSKQNNPAWVVYDFLVDKRYGCCVPVANIDLQSFYSVANYCNGLVLDPIRNTSEVRFQFDSALVSKQSALDFLKDVLSTFRGFLIFSGGQLKLKVEKAYEEGDYLGRNLIVNHDFSAVAVELVSNGGMEIGTPPTGWEPLGSPDTLERSSTQAHSGTYSLHIAETSADTVGSLEYHSEVAQRAYKLSYWYYLVKGRCRAYANRGDASGATSSLSTHTTTGSWIYNEISYFQTVSGVSAGVVFDNAAFADSEFYIDDVSIKELAPGGWYADNLTTLEAVSFAGKNCLHCIDAAGGFLGFSAQDFGTAEVSGKKFKLTFLYYLVSGTLWASLYDATNAEYPAQAQYTSKDRWIYAELVSTAYSSTMLAKVGFQNYSTPLAAEFYIADVHVQEVRDIVTYDEDKIIEDSFKFQEINVANTYNRFEVEFIDSSGDYRHDIVPVDNLHQQWLVKEVRPVTYTMLGIKRRSQASRVATYLRDVSQLCRWRCTFKTDIFGLQNEAGDVIKVTHSTPGWTDKQFKIVRVTESDIDEYTFDCMEYFDELFTDADGRLRDDAISPLPDYYAMPANPARLRADIDIPQSRLDIRWSDCNSSYTMGTQIYYKRPKDYDFTSMPIGHRRGLGLIIPSFIRAPSAYLSAGITAADTEIPFVGELSGPFPAHGYLAIENEHIEYDFCDEQNAKFTGCARGWNTTVATTHTIGTTIPVAKIFSTESNTLVDRTSASSIPMLGVNSDIVYFGFPATTRPNLLTFVVSPNAGVDARLHFNYYSANEGFQKEFWVTDATSGLSSSGVVGLECPQNKTEWGVSTIPTFPNTALYWVGMQRTYDQALSTTPCLLSINARVGNTVFWRSLAPAHVKFDYSDVGTWIIRARTFSPKRILSDVFQVPEIYSYIPHATEPTSLSVSTGADEQTENSVDAYLLFKWGHINDAYNYELRYKRSALADWSYVSVLNQLGFMDMPTKVGSDTLNLFNSGLFTGVATVQARVEIDGTGSPNTFKHSFDNGSTWDTTLVPVSTVWSAIGQGVSVRFNAATGGVSGTYWNFNVPPRTYMLHRIGQLTAGVAYDWQVRSVDVYGRASQWASPPSFPTTTWAPSGFGRYKNILINGDGQVFQRQVVLSLIGPATNSVWNYVLDRWEVAYICSGANNSSGSFTQHVKNGLAPFTNVYGFAFLGITNASTGPIYLNCRTKLEGEISQRLSNLKVSLSCKVWHDWSSNMNIIASIAKANALNNFSSTTSVANSGVQSVPSSAVTIVKIDGLSLNDVRNGLLISVTAYTNTGPFANVNVLITDIQLELNDIATSFEPKPFNIELAACQRYFCKSFPYTAAPNDATGVVGYEQIRTQAAGYYHLFPPVRFPVSMRAAPTVILYNTNHSTANEIYNGTEDTDIPEVIDMISVDSFLASVSNTLVDADNYLAFHWTAEAEL